MKTDEICAKYSESPGGLTVRLLEETNGESLPLVLIEGTPVALKMLAELFEDLADDEPIKQHANGREVLLDGRLGGRRLQSLDVGGDVHGLDISELADA